MRLLACSVSALVAAFIAASASVACTGSAAGAPASVGGDAGEPPDTRPGLDNPAGSPCYTEKDCTAGNFCLVQTSDPEGVCTPTPAACLADLTCQCLVTEVGACAGKQPRCALSAPKSAVIACGQQSPADDRLSNETCSRIVGCAPGLLCFLPGAPPGLCLEAPTDCDPGQDCACIVGQLGSACLEASTPFCTKAFGPTTLECR